jgi:methyltransferase (TIGR00027 family)
VDKASETAALAAQVRAAHAILDPDPIFEDPFALALAGSSESEVRELFSAIPPSCARVARLLPSQRARFADDEVERAVGRGVDQYVVLGAGLDSFAWRRTDLMAHLDVFEVDHPATQAAKLERLAAIDLAPPRQLYFAGVDFTAREGLSAGLADAGFDPGRPSIWSWLGVIVYLPLEAIESTLSSVAALSAPGSELVASYCVPRELMDPASREFDALAREASAAGGEPHISFVAPDEIETIARTAGWPVVRSVAPSSLTAWFAGRSDRLAPVSYEWFLVAES